MKIIYWCIVIVLLLALSYTAWQYHWMFYQDSIRETEDAIRPAATLPLSQNWHSVTNYGNGRFVSRNSTGTAEAYSIDGGETWTSVKPKTFIQR